MLTSIQKLAKVWILAAVVSFAAPVQEGANPLSAYHETNSVQFTPDAGTRRTASLGLWTLGARLNEGKPLDKRLNLYVVIPGKQYHSASSPEYDHNLVVNALTHEKAREWDIFWCFVLDPKLTDDFRSEHDLLAAAQQSFFPADLFDVEDIPGHEVLREKTEIQSLPDLKRFRHKDRSLPRVLIVPAHLAVSGTAELPNAPSDDKATSH